MNLINLLLSESEKRILTALFSVFIFIFVLLGLIGYAITKVMKHQGKRLDNLVSDAVTSKVIQDPKQFRKYASKKNYQLFFKQAWRPILLLLFNTLVWGIISVIFYKKIGGIYDPFCQEYGFASLLYKFDWNAEGVKQKFFGITLIAAWPPVIHKPEFIKLAIPSYVIAPLAIGGVIWFLVCVQAYMARTLRILKLSRTIFDKSLENYNQNTGFTDNKEVK